ncbi:MAG: signal peptidase I [Clostridia bacterium]|nr:signal peptidase I [Clostridia bacterium]
MNRDKKILYAVSITVLAVLLLSLFVDVGSGRIFTAILLLPLTLLTCFLVRKRVSHAVSKKEVTLLMGVIAALYAILIQISGIWFGYYNSVYPLSLSSLAKYILPISIIIITIEIIRSVLLAQKNKLAEITSYLASVVAELLICSNLQGLKSFNQFMDLVGLFFFPAITANLLYHFISKRYGKIPNIVYRSITTLYVYLLPTTPAIPDALMAAIRLLTPLAVWGLVAALFERKRKRVHTKAKKAANGISIVAAVLVMISIVMLISCQFRFGTLVIATESMTGEINKGDVIIYERYDGSAIQEGQVIVFSKGDAKIVHRVVQITQIGGTTRYYTKGDANETMDMGYIEAGQIVGTVCFKVAYVGHPTLWLREAIEQNK